MISALQDIRNAYDARDRETLERALAKIETMLRYTGPVERKPCEFCGVAHGWAHRPNCLLYSPL